MSWQVAIQHGEAVAEKPGRIVALDVSQPYRPRLWSYDLRHGRDFLETAWVDSPGWRSDPRFAGIDHVIADMIRVSPALSGNAKMHHLRALPPSAAVGI